MGLFVSNAVKTTGGNLYVLTIIFWIGINILLVIYDFVIIHSYITVSYYLSKLGRWAVKKEKVSIALYTIRLNYYLSRLSRLLRVGLVTYGSGETSSVWRGLSKRSLTQLSLNIFRLIINVPMFLAFLSACFALRILRGDAAYYLDKLQAFLKDFLQIKVNIGDIFSKLPAFVALMTILPIVFFFYFYSQKRDVQKIIDKENRKYFEEVVLLYRKLFIWIDDHIYELSKNFDYVIQCQNSIVEEFLKNEASNYEELVGNQHYMIRGIEKFRFVEIADLTELKEITTKLFSKELVGFTRVFSAKRFDIWHLFFWDFSSLREEKRFERAFYTKKGMASEISNRNTASHKFTKEEIERKRKEEISNLSMSIYEGLNLLYRLKRSRDSLREYLYSSEAERLILKALNKDK